MRHFETFFDANIPKVHHYCNEIYKVSTLLKANKRIYEGKGQISSSFMTDFIEFGRIDTRGASGLFVNHTFIAFYIDYVT